MKDLEKVKEIFLSPELDTESFAENYEKVNEWENGLRQNKDFLNWQQSDVTKNIALKAKESYKDNAMILMLDRTLLDAQRKSLWAKQDAIVWLLSMIDEDVKSKISQIHREIQTALKAV